MNHELPVTLQQQRYARVRGFRLVRLDFIIIIIVLNVPLLIYDMFVHDLT